MIINQTSLGFGWDEGPNLATARVDHMCGTMTKEGKRFMLVAGGSSITDEHLTDWTTLNYQALIGKNHGHGKNVMICLYLSLQRS